MLKLMEYGLIEADLESIHPYIYSSMNTHVGKSLGSNRLQIDSIIGKDG